ncbi:hypothetical protein AYO44_15180 [Planctomycetaceae bacterium SCGC AG-212-F19]|nr:hypothetical protein AYO44_15180 [Planctomycetaceae bacterium SCGC AG-212-F19]
MNAFRSRWGYHPCDYSTYLLLKELHRLYEKAHHAYAAWGRWARKEPQNRVRRRYLRNAQGQRIGCELLGPLPEPRLSRLFCTRTEVVQSSSGNRLGVRVPFDALGVPEAYRAARKPAATAEEVTPLPWTADEIRRLIALAEEEV